MLLYSLPLTLIHFIPHFTLFLSSSGTSSAGWVYEYRGHSLTSWLRNPTTNNQPAAWVGSVIRKCCHSPTNLVASVASTLASPSPLVRRNFLTLPRTDQLSFVRGIHLLRGMPSRLYPTDTRLSRYDDFIFVHQSMPADSHRSSAFLPWHRAFIAEFEGEMRNVLNNATYTLPYWDWSDNTTRMNIFTSDLFGGNGTTTRTVPVFNTTLNRTVDTVIQNLVGDGLFANFTHTIGLNNTYLPYGLRRCFTCDLEPAEEGSGGHTIMNTDIPPVLPEPEELVSLFNISLYDTFPYSDFSHNPPSFRNTLEGWNTTGCFLHNAVHLFVGGHFASVPISPNDPIFWLHHAFVDKIWDMWITKHKHRDSLTKGYLPKTEGTDPAEVKATRGKTPGSLLSPFGMPIQATFNPLNFGYSYPTDDFADRLVGLHSGG